MKDNEMRGVILQKYYDRRRDGFIKLNESDFDNKLTKEDICHISKQLDEHGLIEWKSIGEIGRGNFSGRGRITASGINVIEKGPETSPIEIKIDNSQYNITESSNVQIGNKNVQDVTIPEEEKSLLQKLLENPLIKFFISLFTRK